MTTPIKQPSENKRRQAAGSTSPVSFPLITSRQSESWFKLFQLMRRNWKLWSISCWLGHQAKVMLYHIWHPKAWEIDPPPSMTIDRVGVWTHTQSVWKGQEWDLCLAQFFCYGNRWSPTMGEISPVGLREEHSVSLRDVMCLYICLSQINDSNLCSWACHSIFYFLCHSNLLCFCVLV